MSTPVRLLPAGGNTATLNSYVGLARELAINTDNWAVYVFDGVTPGGHIVGGMSALNQGSDVSIVTPTNNQALVYNSTAGKWENQTLVSTDLSDWAAVTANYVTSSSLASTLSGYLTTAAASSTYVSAANPTFTGTATVANLTVTGTLSVTGGTTIPGYLSISGGTMTGNLSMGANTLFATNISEATSGTPIGMPDVTMSGTLTAAQIVTTGHITQEGTVPNTFSGGVQVIGATTTNAAQEFVSLGNTPGWGYGIKFSSASTTVDASTYFLGANTGGANSILALFGVADSGSIGRSVMQFSRSATAGAGIAWAGVTIGNVTDNPSVTIDGQLSINDNSNATTLLSMSPSWGPVAPPNYDSCQWLSLQGSPAMATAGQTFTTTDARMLTITRGENNHPTIRVTSLDFLASSNGGQVNVTNGAFTSANYVVAGSNTVNFNGGPILQCISNNTAANSDLIVARAIPGTANASGPGVGASMQLYSGNGSIATQTSGSMFQNSGGQTELWQYNGGSWHQVFNVTAAGVFNLNPPISGGHVFLCGAGSNPLQINAGSSAGGSGNLAMKINNFSPGSTIMTLDGAGNLNVGGTVTAANLTTGGTLTTAQIIASGHIAQTGGVTNTFTTGATFGGGISVSGNITATGSVSGGFQYTNHGSVSSATFSSDSANSVHTFTATGGGPAATLTISNGGWSPGDYLIIICGSLDTGGGQYITLQPASGLTLRWLMGGAAQLADGAHKLALPSAVMIVFDSGSGCYVLPYSGQNSIVN